MTLPSADTLAPLLALILYIVIKDLVIPAQRRRNHRNGNPGYFTTGEILTRVMDLEERVRIDGETNTVRCADLMVKVREAAVQSEARWDEQRRVNARMDSNVARIFERLDEGRRK